MHLAKQVSDYTDSAEAPSQQNKLYTLKVDPKKNTNKPTKPFSNYYVEKNFSFQEANDLTEVTLEANDLAIELESDAQIGL